MIGFLGCHSRKVCSLLPVSGVIIVVDPVTKGPAAWRAFPDDDDAVAIGVRLYRRPASPKGMIVNVRGWS
jgi:hypothetical protein